mgnify:CR=1 FL=1
MNSPSPRKLRVATASLAGCFGCHMSFLDIDEHLFELVELIEFDRSPLTDIKDVGPCDIGLIEGGVCNAENVHVLREFRRNCKTLIALGACAVNGGLPAQRNHIPLAECLREVYQFRDGVANGQIYNIGNPTNNYSVRELATMMLELAKEYPEYLNRVYKEANFSKPRNLIGMQKDLPVEEMEKLMLANLPAGDDEVRALAQQRAETVQHVRGDLGLVSGESIHPDAVQIVDGRSQPDRLSDRRCAGLEAQRHPVPAAAAEADLAHRAHQRAALEDRHAVDDAAHARPQLLQVADLGAAAACHMGQARVGDHVLRAPACGRAWRQAEELLVHGADVAHQPFMVGHRDRLVRVGQEHVEDGEGEGHACHHVEQRRRLVGDGDPAHGIRHTHADQKKPSFCSA